MNKQIFSAIFFYIALHSLSAHANTTNVTLYGTLDIGVGRTFNDAATSVRGSKTPSNWGIRGREDLGNGAYAMFNLESSPILVDTGSYSDSGGFTRQAWVGLGGGFGEILLGRTTTPQARFMGRYDLNGLSESNPWKTLDVSANGSFGGARHSNQLQYASPNINNIQFRASYSFDETVRSQAGAKDAQLQLGINYKKEKFNAGMVIMPSSLSGQLDSADKKTYQTAFSIGFMYQSDDFKVSTLLQRDEKKSVGDSLGFGASIPLGAFEFGAQYAKIIKSENQTFKNASAFEIFSNYKISKRTSLYIIAASVNNKTKTVRKLRNKNSLSAGVIQKF